MSAVWSQLRAEVRSKASPLTIMRQRCPVGGCLPSQLLWHNVLLWGECSVHDAGWLVAVLEPAGNRTDDAPPNLRLVPRRSP